MGLEPELNFCFYIDQTHVNELFSLSQKKKKKLNHLHPMQFLQRVHEYPSVSDTIANTRSVTFRSQILRLAKLTYIIQEKCEMNNK